VSPTRPRLSHHHQGRGGLRAAPPPPGCSSGAAISCHHPAGRPAGAWPLPPQGCLAADCSEAGRSPCVPQGGRAGGDLDGLAGGEEAKRGRTRGSARWGRGRGWTAPRSPPTHPCLHSPGSQAGPTSVTLAWTGVQPRTEKSSDEQAGRTARTFPHRLRGGA